MWPVYGRCRYTANISGDDAPEEEESSFTPGQTSIHVTNLSFSKDDIDL